MTDLDSAMEALEDRMKSQTDDRTNVLVCNVLICLAVDILDLQNKYDNLAGTVEKLKKL